MDLTDEEIAELCYHLQFIGKDRWGDRTADQDAILKWIQGASQPYDYEWSKLYHSVMGVAKVLMKIREKRRRPFGEGSSLGISLDRAVERSSGDNSPADRSGQ